MKIIERKDFDKIKCCICKKDADYIANIPVKNNYRSAARLHISLCKNCTKLLYNMRMTTYGKGL